MTLDPPAPDLDSAAAAGRLPGELTRDLAHALGIVEQMQAADLPPALRFDLTRLEAALTTLGAGIDRAAQALRRQEGGDAPAGAAMDETRFLRLLEIAGPGDSVEIVARLHLDLKTVRSGLFAALDRREPDWTALRAQTHVLIALAGVVGADALQHLAEAMNAAAHRRDLRDAQDLREAAARELDRLIAYIARRDRPEAR
ncbi:MAG: hypothetical protein V7668_08100 [Cereibacter changlensis]